ncbi:hypothetical protein G6O69_31060 [Pseudenhygromyxa sp. WMMC2535]|uniref:hypothetical protein n=1 Tax=Pseudenhygromyxa sp. WMMC2535 TaxID=2712867 RepID=UPI001556544D|nr:hypothetical protein [Pseudenhygromyxa sp. WMMC2535]NVB42304.1 hypothetical protein [Pseudenhygromyxa sp. WMMC2535]
MRVVALLATLLAPPEQPAEPLAPAVQRPRRLQLEWQGPPACPSIDEVRERLDARLPELDAPLLPGQLPLEVHAQLVAAPSNDEFELELSLVRGRESHARVIRASSCSLLTDAAVLVIAVTLDPVATALNLPAKTEAPTSPSVPEPEPEPEPGPGPALGPPEPAPQRPTEREPPPAPDLDLDLDLDPPTRPRSAEPGRARGLEARGLQLAARVLPSGGYGPTNTAYASIGGGLAVLGERWRAGADARWVVPRSVTRSDGVGGSFDAWLLGALGCFVPGRRHIELPLCAGLEAGQLRARGLDTLPVATRATIPHVALRLSQGITWVPLEHLAFGFDLELAAPLTRGEFVVDDLLVQRVPPLTVRGILGVELRLPRAGASRNK